MKTLAEGGYQVGSLARTYYPGGIEITELKRKTALEKTAELLEKENCIIYGAALSAEKFFVRVDILVKKGNHIRLIEVKAKSYSGNANEGFYTPNGKITAEWEKYLLDMAYQTYVAY